jgi:hypothetical protein
MAILIIGRFNGIVNRTTVSSRADFTHPLPKIAHHCQKYPGDAGNTPSPGFKPRPCEKSRNVSKKSLNAAKNPAALSKNIAALPKFPRRFKKKAQHCQKFRSVSR